MLVAAQSGCEHGPPERSHGIRHIVILMMENRSFDHFLGWLPGANGRPDLTFVSAGLRPLAASRA
jgi:phospholipase C